MAQTLTEQIKNRAASGAFQLPNIKDVIVEYDESYVTVNRAFRQLMKEGVMNMSKVKAFFTSAGRKAEKVCC